MSTVRTSSCVICGAPATNFTGHLHTVLGNIIAGFCSVHVPRHGTSYETRISVRKNCAGCFGDAVKTDKVFVDEYE